MIHVGVVIPTLTNKEGGYEAIQSIKPSLNMFWTPVIIDNWREPRCLAKSWNDGIELCIEQGCEYIAVINDDVLFSPWTLTGMVERFKNPPIENTLMITGRNIRGSLGRPEDVFELPIKIHEEEELVEAPDFSCFMLKPSTFGKIGKFDENFIPAYFEDNDYHRRISILGGHAVNTSWAEFYHYGSLTQNRDLDTAGAVCNPFLFEQNAAYYRMKWGGPPGMETFATPYNEGMGPTWWKSLR